MLNCGRSFEEKSPKQDSLQSRIPDKESFAVQPVNLKRGWFGKRPSSRSTAIVPYVPPPVSLSAWTLQCPPLCVARIQARARCAKKKHFHHTGFLCFVVARVALRAACLTSTKVPKPVLALCNEPWINVMPTPPASPEEPDLQAVW